MTFFKGQAQKSKMTVELWCLVAMFDIETKNLFFRQTETSFKYGKINSFTLPKRFSGGGGWEVKSGSIVSLCQPMIALLQLKTRRRI